MLSSVCLNAQRNKKGKPDNDYLVYKQALEYADYTVARVSLMNLIVKNPKTPEWKDTLLTLYGLMGMYEQAILLGEEIVKTKDNDTNSLSIIAVSYESIGVLGKAIEYYEKVLALSNDITIRYKLAVCQYGLQRYGEAMANIDNILNDTRSENAKISITIDKVSQQVSMLAAALNVGGIILTDTRKYEDAKFYFENALKLEPDFALAKNNLQVVISLMQKEESK